MEEKKMRAILVGRHDAGEIPGVEIVTTVNQLWSLETKDLANQFQGLVNLARSKSAAIVLQNVPGALAHYLLESGSFPLKLGVQIGIMISKPGTRLAGVSQVWEFSSIESAELAASAIKFANGRATVTVTGSTVTVTVDPVTPFILERIAWVLI